MKPGPSRQHFYHFDSPSLDPLFTIKVGQFLSKVKAEHPYPSDLLEVKRLVGDAAYGGLPVAVEDDGVDAEAAEEAAVFYLLGFVRKGTLSGLLLYTSDTVSLGHSKKTN